MNSIQLLETILPNLPELHNRELKRPCEHTYIGTGFTFRIIDPKTGKTQSHKAGAKNLATNAYESIRGNFRRDRTHPTILQRNPRIFLVHPGIGSDYILELTI